MNWRLENACVLAIRISANAVASVVKVSLSNDILERFCIGLCLLKEGLIDSLDLVDHHGSVFRLQRSDSAICVRLGEGKTILTLSEIELERWVHFTLRTVRDGIADVDHFDVEAPLAGSSSEIVDVVIAFPASVPPVSPNEVRRRLGLG